jgi:hypothetical protein
MKAEIISHPYLRKNTGRHTLVRPTNNVMRMLLITDERFIWWPQLSCCRKRQGGRSGHKDVFVSRWYHARGYSVIQVAQMQKE